MTDARGYCFASNDYFADLYGASVRTVQRYLDALKAGGFISIQDGDGGAGRRKIYAGINPLADNHDKNVMVPENHDKNVTETMTEMSRTNNVINKKDNNKPPISPKKEKPTKAPMSAELMARVEAYAGADLELRDALIDFAEKRKARKKPINTQRTLTLLLSRLNELSRGSRKAKLALINEAIMNDWLSFYAHDAPELHSSDARSVAAPAEVAQW